MPYLPTLQAVKQSQIVTSVFLGYNRNLKIGEGKNNAESPSSLEFYDMENLTSDYYPLMANRGKRGVVAQLTAPGGMIAKEKLAYVDDGKLYYDGVQVAGITLTSGEKQLVSMGAYLVIWPDKKYVNTANLSDYGSIDSSFSTTGSISYAICDVYGLNISNIFPTKPTNPQAGDYWLDKTVIPHTLKQFDDITSSWVVVPSVYTKITSTGIGTAFRQYDGVNISGIVYSGTDPYIQEQYDELNGSKVIFAKDNDYIVVVGMIDANYTQTTGTVSVSRSSPDLDFVVESQNRLWGCRYGVVDGAPINEIYACSLGDFRNWNEVQGVSTDSYAASVGTDGKWTGAITFLGNPIFFKENVMHKVYVSNTGAHQITDTACRGVQDGCDKSLAIVGERLFYKSRSGVMMYDGSLPQSVSDALGVDKYSNAVAGAINDKYYISMLGENDEWNLFALDTKRGLWHREDETHALAFSRFGGELYYIDAETSKLMAVKGGAGTLESVVEWAATTGLIGYTTVEQKYISRFDFRMQLPKGSSADLYIQYDSDGIWNHCGHMVGYGTGSFMLPVRPRRCDHFAFRIEGAGDVRIYSVSKIFEAGSDFL